MLNRPLLIIVFMIFLLFFAFLQLPLSVALSLSGVQKSDLSWGTVEGTVWNGQMLQVKSGSHPIGDVTIHTKPLALLTGKWESRVEVNGRFAQGSGKFAKGIGGASLKNAKFRLNLTGYNIKDAFGSPIGGLLDVTVRQYSYNSKGCKKGDFKIWTDTLTIILPKYGIEGFPLEGVAECSDGNVILPLAGGNGTESVDIVTTVAPNLDYKSNIEITTLNADMRNGLRLYGFAVNGDRLTYMQRGNFTENP